MQVLRTPESRFENLVDYPFESKYVNVEGIRIHYIDEGPKDASPILLLHGEPTWSYLYRHMIRILVQQGYRVIAPDLVGCGKSDKLPEKSAYSYANHVAWMSAWLRILDLRGVVLFCQDWGSLIGLRLVAAHEDRFSGVVLSNGGLPDGKQKFSKAFQIWKAFSKYSPIFKAGSIVKMGCVTPLSKDAIDAYDAPFPDNRYKAGIRIFPSLVPDAENVPGAKDNQNAWEVFKRWEKPFLTVFGKQDPITRGGERFFIKTVPGCKGQDHTLLDHAGHFIQEDQPEKLAEIIVAFVKKNGLAPL